MSQATVSIVLSGSASAIRVSSATRARVLAAADHLGYIPNHAAQSLRRRSTRSITFINPAPENPYFTEVIGAAQVAAEEAGYGIFAAVVANPEGAVQILSHLNAGTSDGVIVGSRDPGVLNELRYAIRRGVAAVAIQPAIEEHAISAVRTDKEAGGNLATRHLIQLGHRRIAHLADGAAYARHPSERTAGYRRALAEAGIDFDPRWLVEGTNNVAGGDAATRALLDRPGPRPTATFVFNDQMAIGALHALRVRGLRVPDDMAIVGFDGIDLGAFTNPELTTVAQPRADIGRRAVELVFELLEGQTSEVRDITLPLHLLVRESCGASEQSLEVGDDATIHRSSVLAHRAGGDAADFRCV